MQFTQQDVEKLAELARIELTEEEKEKFGRQLSLILEYVEQVNEVDAGEITVGSHLDDRKNTSRKDDDVQYMDTKKIIEQFPEQFGNLNKVKPILENDDES